MLLVILIITILLYLLIILVDDSTILILIFLMKYKSNAYAIVFDFLIMLLTQFEYNIEYFILDNKT